MKLFRTIVFIGKTGVVPNDRLNQNDANSRVATDNFLNGKTFLDVFGAGMQNLMEYLPSDLAKQAISGILRDVYRDSVTIESNPLNVEAVGGALENLAGNGNLGDNAVIGFNLNEGGEGLAPVRQQGQQEGVVQPTISKALYRLVNLIVKTAISEAKTPAVNNVNVAQEKLQVPMNQAGIEDVMKGKAPLVAIASMLSLKDLAGDRLGLLLEKGLSQALAIENALNTMGIPLLFDTRLVAGVNDNTVPGGDNGIGIATGVGVAGAVNLTDIFSDANFMKTSGQLDLLWKALTESSDVMFQKPNPQAGDNIFVMYDVKTGANVADGQYISGLFLETGKIANEELDKTVLGYGRRDAFRYIDITDNNNSKKVSDGSFKTISSMKSFSVDSKNLADTDSEIQDYLSRQSNQNRSNWFAN